MNYNYYSYTNTDYPTMSYPTTDFASPSTTNYSYMPTCPIHSSYYYYVQPSPSLNISRSTYGEYQTSPTASSYMITTPPPIVQQPTIDRTPLRRHQCYKKSELVILHQVYSQDPHPTQETLELLATQLKSTVDKVRQWFKNRRHSDKHKRRDMRVTTTSKSS